MSHQNDAREAKKQEEAVKSQKLSLRRRVNTAALCVCWMRRLRVHQQIGLFVCTTTHTQFTRSETFDSRDSPDFKLWLGESIIIEANLKMSSEDLQIFVSGPGVQWEQPGNVKHAENCRPLEKQHA